MVRQIALIHRPVLRINRKRFGLFSGVKSGAIRAVTSLATEFLSQDQYSLHQ
jgi:hypothetical protein